MNGLITIAPILSLSIPIGLILKEINFKKRKMQFKKCLFERKDSSDDSFDL